MRSPDTLKGFDIDVATEVAFRVGLPVTWATPIGR
jgi:hypothetical protein